MTERFFYRFACTFNFLNFNHFSFLDMLGLVIHHFWWKKCFSRTTGSYRYTNSIELVPRFGLRPSPSAECKKHTSDVKWTSIAQAFVFELIQNSYKLEIWSERNIYQYRHHSNCHQNQVDETLILDEFCDRTRRVAWGESWQRSDSLLWRLHNNQVSWVTIGCSPPALSSD